MCGFMQQITCVSGSLNEVQYCFEQEILGTIVFSLKYQQYFKWVH